MMDLLNLLDSKEIGALLQAAKQKIASDAASAGDKLKSIVVADTSVALSAAIKEGQTLLADLESLVSAHSKLSAAAAAPAPSEPKPEASAPEPSEPSAPAAEVPPEEQPTEQLPAVSVSPEATPASEPAAEAPAAEAPPEEAAS